MTVWFTSDLHIGHSLVAEHRDFATIEAHDQAIYDNWSAAVRSDDHVWVLGDIAMRDVRRALSELSDLPGIKHLIAGNHDPVHPMHRDAWKWQREFLETFASVQAFARRKIAGQTVLLSHFPYAADRDEARYVQYRLRDMGEWLLHGHTHSTERRTGPRELHVGLDAWGMRLVRLGEVERLVAEESRVLSQD